jgi:PII-like signaling protein
MMKPNAALLRVYTDESAYFGDRKVFEYIASLARDHQLAGVTVLEALVGFGRSAHLHRRHVLENDRAVVIEIVDMEEKLRRFAGALNDVPDVGLVTLSAVEILGGKAESVLPGDAA